MRASRIAIAILVIALSGRGGILYDAEKNVIRVEGFPSSMPCDLKTLWLTDRANGWGKVRRAAAGGGYRIDADLMIGGNLNQTDSFFRIGSAATPRETATLNGDLTVFPYFIQGSNAEEKPGMVKPVRNVLLIGDEDDLSVRPTLRFARGKTLRVGYVSELNPPSGGSWQHGGEIRVFNALISSIAPGRENAFGGKRVYIHPFAVQKFKNVVISNFSGTFYGVSGEFADCVFEKGGGVIVGKAGVKDCVFAELETAIIDSGGLDAAFENCLFTGNARNFSLRYGRGVECVDCVFGKVEKPNLVEVVKGPKSSISPKLVVKRHVVVKVVDAAGAPVAGAAIVASPDAPGEDSRVVAAVTGANGETPAKNTAGAILLTERFQLADRAETLVSYRISAEKNGLQASTRYVPNGDAELKIALPVTP